MLRLGLLESGVIQLTIEHGERGKRGDVLGTR
jgi:hypothetical protein